LDAIDKLHAKWGVLIGGTGNLPDQVYF